MFRVVEEHFTTFWCILVYCANLKLYLDGVFLYCNACLVYFTKFPLCLSVLGDLERKENTALKL